MIRPFQEEDRVRLKAIFKLNTPKYFDPNELTDFEAYLNQKPETYLTVEVDGVIVGGTGYYFKEDDSSGRITWIFFDPAYAGKGLGRESVEYCLDKLKSDTRVKKVVVTTSQLANSFFEKFGFQLTYFEKNHWGEGLDLYEMELNDFRN